MSGFQVAHLDSQSVPVVTEYPVEETQEFLDGALCVVVDGELVEFNEGEHGEPEVVALAPYGVEGTVPYDGAPSMDILGGLGILPGRMQVVPIVRNVPNVFTAQYSGNLPATAGGSYGVVRGSDRVWRVNFADTTDPIVKLERIDWAQGPLNKNRVHVSFLPLPEEY